MAQPRHAAAPRLETPRLILRSFRAEDLQASHEMWNEPAVYKFISGKPSSVEDVWKGVLQTIGHWQLLGYGYWIIEDKTTGKAIGNAGFGHFMRDMVPDMNETPEAGWSLKTAYHGQRLGTEAVRAVLAWGDANLSHDTFASIIAPENAASLRLAQKLGFHEVARTVYKEDPTVLLHRDRRG